MSARSISGELVAALKRLRLGGLLPTLAERLTLAEKQDTPYEDLLLMLLTDEISRRDSTASIRRAEEAGLDPDMLFERWDKTAKVTYDRRVMNELSSLRFVEDHRNVVILGPVGVGKSHVAQALGHLAIRHSAEVRFLKTSRALAHLAGGHADHTWHKRLAELARPAVLILDDFAMRELTPAQADDLYELISERTGKSLILTSNRAPQDWYPLFPNPVVAESLLDRVINNSHQVFMNGPSYRPNKRPGERVTTTPDTAAK